MNKYSKFTVILTTFFVEIFDSKLFDFDQKKSHAYIDSEQEKTYFGMVLFVFSMDFELFKTRFFVKKRDKTER